MSLLDLIKPAPYIDEIKDAETVKKNYKYWRIRVFYSMYIGYVFYYLTRKSFTFAMPSMMQDLGYTKSDLGILASILALTYGASKFLSGVLADRTNPRYFMAFGLIATGIFNIAFGLSSSIFLFAIFWGLNGFFQGWGWPPCARLLTHWYSIKERGTWWGSWSTAHGVGGFAIPLLAAVCAQYLGWRYALYLPGILCILVGFYLINRLRDTPQSLGLPPIEKFNNDYATNQHGKERELPMKTILFDFVLRNKFIWILAIAYLFVYVIRTAINDWSMLFLVETKNYSQITAGACVGCFEIGGIFGSFIAGWASDKIFKGRRGPVNVLFSLGVIFAIGAFWLSPAGSVALDSALLFLIGFLIFGPQMLIGMVAAEVSHKKAAGAATGFVGWIAYLGAAAAGYPLGKLTQEWGWGGFFTILAACGGICFLLLLPLWSIRSRVVSAPHEEEEKKSLSPAETKAAKELSAAKVEKVTESVEV